KGPTAAEAKQDIRTQIPRATRLRGVTVGGGVATVDLTRPFVEGTDEISLVARLTQLVWTATAIPGVTGIRLWIQGRQASSAGQGVSVAGTLTRKNVDPPKPELLPPTTVVPDKTGPGSAGGESTDVDPAAAGRAWVSAELGGHRPPRPVDARRGDGVPGL